MKGAFTSYPQIKQNNTKSLLDVIIKRVLQCFCYAFLLSLIAKPDSNVQDVLDNQIFQCVHSICMIYNLDYRFPKWNVFIDWFNVHSAFEGSNFEKSSRVW